MPFFKKFRIFSRHRKLCEEWALANSRECVDNGSSKIGSGSRNSLRHDDNDETSEATFTLKYLGSTLVETPSSEEATAEAIKTVITMAKASGKKLQRVALAVSLRGIRMTDLATEEDQLQVSIYRISYCSADATHDHVFAFIATNLNETMECHAFLCPKRKMAQTVTLTVAQAFNTAYEAWLQSQSEPRIHHTLDKSPSSSELATGNSIIENDKSLIKSSDADKPGNDSKQKNEKNLLIDLSNEVKSTDKSWVCFEDEATEIKKVPKKTSNNNIPMTTIRHASSTNHHVVPRPSPGFKVQNAWGESRSVDLICS
ncbi:low density lipoprotein receptor adapter protein 1-B-like isoform X2 [Microplitis mediator]|uniref:low density lipoprotein receptor adapter protein 1-B-like isoform X2 n=1 Tax=Microplitis mediator TaxID=375433 RepID=UPI0025524972|nr:low density lipoprotein receptor adapter protein 1-B-like isoform X2 [Microplitis mediator]